MILYWEPIFLPQNAVIIDYSLGNVNICDDLVTVPLQNQKNRLNCVRTTQAVCIPAYSEAIVPVSCPVYYDNKIALLEPITTFQFRNFATARSLSSCKKGLTVCRILNYNSNTLVLRKHAKVASIQKPASIVSAMRYSMNDTEVKKTHVEPKKQSLETLDDFLSEYGFKINAELNTDQKYQLLQLLFNYKDVFARTLGEIKQYPNYELKAELVSNKRCFKRQYRLHTDDAKEAQNQINEMVQTGILEESKTVDYNSPVFLVNKKDGTKRLVVDLRGVNALIAPRLVQLPKINDLLDEITSHKCMFLSSIDLKSGYYQLNLHQNTRPLTSFTSPFDGRRWQYRVCPFGLHVSASAMLSVLASVFSGRLKDSTIALYMDDLMLFSATFEHHLKIVKKMLQTLRDNNLSANPGKCEFAFSELEFLCFRISANSIRISERKVKAIKSITAPTNKKSLQRLLGLFNFFRKFVRNYSQNTYHMRQLLTKNTQFLWTPECQTELDYLKQCLMNDPILKPINPEKDIIIMADASQIFGFGFVLLQYGIDGNLHVVSYGAQSLTSAQKKYTPAELGLLAVILALKQYEYFVVHKQLQF